MVQQTQLERYVALGQTPNPAPNQQAISRSVEGHLTAGSVLTQQQVFETSPLDDNMDYSRPEYADAQLTDSQYLGEAYDDGDIDDDRRTASGDFYSVLKTG